MNFLQNIFRLIPVPCLVVKAESPCFRMENVNQAYLRVTGTKEADLIGKNFFEVFPANPACETNPACSLRHSLLTVIRTREPHRMTAQRYDMRIKEGGFDTRYWNIENIPVFTRQGDVSHIIHVAHEVTEKQLPGKEKTGEEKMFDEMFYRNRLPMWIYESESLKFLEVNDAAVKQYGYSRKEFLSMTLRDIRPVEEVSALEEIIARPDERLQAYFSDRFRHKKKNGEIIRVDIYSSRIFFRGIKSRLVIASNVTRKGSEADRLKYQDEVMQEISRVQSHMLKASLSPAPDNGSTIQPEYLLVSAAELDHLVREITSKTQQLNYMRHLNAKYNPKNKP